jgi:hypothetical protein
VASTASLAEPIPCKAAPVACYLFDEPVPPPPRVKAPPQVLALAAAGEPVPPPRVKAPPQVLALAAAAPDAGWLASPAPDAGWLAAPARNVIAPPPPPPPVVVASLALNVFSMTRMPALKHSIVCVNNNLFVFRIKFVIHTRISI